MHATFTFVGPEWSFIYEFDGADRAIFYTLIAIIAFITGEIGF
jgi:hypothetical protein